MSAHEIALLTDVGPRALCNASCYIAQQSASHGAQRQTKAQYTYANVPSNHHVHFVAVRCDHAL